MYVFYTDMHRKSFLKMAKIIGVGAVVKKFGVTGPTLYKWSDEFGVNIRTRKKPKNKSRSKR